MTASDQSKSMDGSYLDRLLLDAAAEALLLIDQTGVIRHSNNAGEWLFGRSRAELVGSPLDNFIPDANRLWQPLLRHYSDDPEGKLSARYATTRLADGQVIPIELTLTLVANTADLLIAAAVRDRGAMARVENNAADNSTDQTGLMKAVFDSVPGMLYLYNAQGFLVSWNKQHEKMTGYSAEELKGLNATDWFEGEDLRFMKQAWQQVFEEGFAEVELAIKIKGGEKVPYRLTGVRVVIDGAPHLVGIGIDISHQKQLESDFSRQRLEWEHLSRVALAGELTAALAHELNQPLTAIMNNAQVAQRMIEKGPIDVVEFREIFADIVADDRRAGEIISHVRDLLKKKQSQPAPLNISALIHSACQLVSSDAIMHNIQILFDLAEGLPAIFGDRIQLQQVLLNLIINAFNAMKQDDCSNRLLVLQTRLVDAGMVEVAVKDSANGIAPDKLDKIFESFVTTRAEGLGMGLSLARSMIERHGGRIWAANQPEGGAIVSFTVPVAAEGERVGGMGSSVEV